MRFLCIIILTILIYNINVFSQSPDTVWTRTFGWFGNDEGNSVIQASDGGIVTVGIAENGGVGSQKNLYFIKTDINGELVWENYLQNGPNDDGGYSLQQTIDGGYIITGFTESDWPVDSDVWLIKTDVFGNVTWSKSLGNDDKNEIGRSVLQTQDGGYIITGSISDTGGVFPPINVLVIKTDENGDQEWSSSFGGQSKDVGMDVGKTQDGGYVILAQSSSFGPGNIDYWLIRIDENGNELWSNTYGGSLGDWAYEIEVTEGNEYVMVGQTGSFGNDPRDVLLIKADSLGNVIWFKTYGEAGHQSGQSLTKSNNGGFVIVGHSQSGVASTADLLIIEIDYLGNETKYFSFGGDSIDAARSVYQLSDGGYIVVGQTHSFGIGERDLWMVRFNPGIVGVESSEQIIMGYYLDQNYPNPFNPITTINYQIPVLSFVTLKVYDVLGKETATLVNKEMVAGNYVVEFNAIDLPSGIYFYRLSAGDFVETKKLVLLK